LWHVHRAANVFRNVGVVFVLEQPPQPITSVLFVVDDQDGGLQGIHLTHYCHFAPHHSSTQSFTVLYQSREFCGFSTQWPSSGKYNIFDGTFSRCRVVKSWKPSLTSSRKSSWPCTTSVGVLNFSANRCGENFR